jgi:hypothetical protein
VRLGLKERGAKTRADEQELDVRQAVFRGELAIGSEAYIHQGP